MNQKEVFQDTEHLRRQQDEKLDMIITGLGQTKQHTKDIDDEIEKQKPLIHHIKKDQDNLQTRMDKANRKIKHLINSQSYCCLYCIIALQVVLFILLVLL